MQFLNSAQLRAKLGGRSRAAIYNDWKAGRLPKPIRLGGRNYWPEDILDAHLRSQFEAAFDSEA